jgi:indole-3-glycerol phosphate synthase/phosphoribosylanthranilate isomerase
VEAEGPDLGVEIPTGRSVPLASFAKAPGLICEIKRRSPSRGSISSDLDPVRQAELYRSYGVDSISILTEEDYFAGSLVDLMRVKERFGDIAVLRKDFLLSVADIEVSYRAGADAVLLIAASLSESMLASMHARAIELGMAALVEVHDLADIEKLSWIRPPLVGINSRDLVTFHIDPIVPIRLKPHITWPARVIFESGIFEKEQAALARSEGFSGVLVGEAVVRKPERISGILAGLTEEPSRPFWTRLYSGPVGPGAGASGSANKSAATGGRAEKRPLVKICGLARAADARLADSLGADLLGFVFADSPRRASEEMVRELGETGAQKVAVVVGPKLPAEVKRLLSEGHLQAVQFHGDEAPDECYPNAFPYYKAVRLGESEDVARLASFHCPRVLLDAFSRGARGGTGKRIEPGLVEEAAERGPLWLAGGLDPENISEIVGRFKPELVDASSGLEAEPGRKDPEKLRRFFQEVENAKGV